MLRNYIHNSLIIMIVTPAYLIVICVARVIVFESN